MFAEWLLIGTLLWSVVTLVVIGFLVFFIEKEEADSAFWTVLAFIAVNLILGNGGSYIYARVTHNPWILVAWAVGYLGIGIAYTIYWWYSKCHKRNRRFEEEVVVPFLESKNIYDERKIPQDDDDMKKEFTKHVLEFHQTEWTILDGKDRDANGDAKRKPSTKIYPSKNKAMLFTVLFNWPWVGAWQIFGDLLKDTWHFIYNRLGKYLSAISDTVSGKQDVNFVDIDDEEKTS